MPEQRKNGGGGPPTVIMKSFQEMGSKGRMRMRIAGAVTMTFSAGVPMIAGIFYELSLPYLTFAGVIFFGGFCLLWPEMGLTLIDRVPAGIATIIPTKLFNRVADRRADRTKDEEK